MTNTPLGQFLVVQPYGPDLLREVTVLSDHAKRSAAFAAVDAIVLAAHRTGTPLASIEKLGLTVVDSRTGEALMKDSH